MHDVARLGYSPGHHHRSPEVVTVALVPLAAEAEPTEADTAESDRVGRTRPRPAPGERDHGELSQSRLGPDSDRHAEDVEKLLTEQHDEAKKALSRAHQDRDRADRDIEKWTGHVKHYNDMLAALRRVKSDR